MWGVNKDREPAIQCSLVKSPTTYLEPTARQKIQLLMDEYTHQEWLAYLRGRISKRENIFVEDILVPPHSEVSSGSAEAEPFHIPKDCVGIIHSHHSMGAFHSGTDQSYVDKNFPVSITVSKDANGLTYDAICYSKTPCGKGHTLKSPVKYVSPQPTFDSEKFLKGAKKNIDKGKKIYVAPAIAGGYEIYPYVPVKYRGFGADVVTDKDGHVLSQTELDDIKYNSWIQD